MQCRPARSAVRVAVGVVVEVGHVDVAGGVFKRRGRVREAGEVSSLSTTSAAPARVAGVVNVDGSGVRAGDYEATRMVDNAALGTGAVVM